MCTGGQAAAEASRDAGAAWVRGPGEGEGSCCGGLSGAADAAAVAVAELAAAAAFLRSDACAAALAYVALVAAADV
jgi:hypothetical protein